MPDRLTGLETAPSIWRILATPQGRVLLSLALAIFAFFFITLAIFPAAPLIAGELQIAPQAVSGILGASTLIATVLALPVGALSNKWGRKPFVLGGLLLATFALILCLDDTFLSLFIAGWMLFGVGRGLFFFPMFAVPVDLFDFRQRGRVIRVITTAVGLGSVAGFVAGGLVSQSGGWRAIFLVGAALLCVAAMIIAQIPETNIVKSSKPLADEVKDALKWFGHPQIAGASLIVALSFAVGICATFLTPFVAAHAHISAAVVALLFIPRELVTSLGASVIEAIADRIGRKISLAASFALVALVTFAFAHFVVSPFSLFICFSLIGLSEGPVVVLTTTIVIRQSMRIHSRGIGAALGSNRIAQGLGLAFGTSVGGVLLERFGAAGSFRVLGIMMVLLALFALTVKN